MKILLLSLIALFPLQAISADDSVYSWGSWSQGVQPAAGPVAHAPAPVQAPNVTFRPNENAAFYRVTKSSRITTVQPEVVITSPANRFR